MKSLEQLRQEATIKESQRKRIPSGPSPELYEKLEREREAKRRRIEEARRASKNHYDASGVESLLNDYARFFNEVEENKYMSISNADAQFDVNKLKSKNDGYRRHTALVFPYAPNEESFAKSVTWQRIYYNSKLAKLKNTVTGINGFIVEVRPEGLIRFVGNRIYFVEKSEWEKSSDVLENALNNVVKEPLRLERRQFAEKIPDTSGFNPSLGL